MTGIDRIIVSSDDKVTAGEENFTVEVSRYIYDTGDIHGKMGLYESSSSNRFI